MKNLWKRMGAPLAAPVLVTLVLVTLIFGTAIGAQEPIPDNSEDAWPAIFGETAEVRVVEIETFVTDKDGQPAIGLNADDFILLVNGEPVPLANFYAVAEGQARQSPIVANGTEAQEEPPLETPRLHLAIFVDNPHISTANRSRLLSRLRELLLAERREDLHTMVLSHNQPQEREFEVRQGLTAVPHEVFMALEELEKSNASGPRYVTELRALMRGLDQLPREGAGDRDATGISALDMQTRALIPQVHSYAEQRRAAVEASLGSLAQAVDLLAGVPGQKALLYVSEGLPRVPGLPAFEVLARRMEVLGIPVRFNADSEAARYDVTVAMEALAARANAAGVRLYTLDAAPNAAARRGSAEFVSAAAGQEFSTFDEGNRRSTLGFMAEATGGRTAFGNAAHSDMLNGVFQDHDYFYSLAYALPPQIGRPEENAGQQEAQNLEVRISDELRRAGYKVRHRRDWRPRRADERLAQHAFSAVLTAEQDNPLKITVRPGTPTPVDGAVAGDKDLMVVPLMVEVPLSELVLLPEKSEHRARVQIVVAVRDEAGRTSEAANHLCPIRVPNSEMLTALGRSTVCGVRLAMRTGRQKVGVAVYDELADVVSTAVLPLEILAAAPPAENTAEPANAEGRD